MSDLKSCANCGVPVRIDDDFCSDQCEVAYTERSESEAPPAKGDG